MSLVGKILAGFFRGATPPSAAETERQAEWAAALKAQRLPAFVAARLSAAAAGKTPWIATLAPAELGLLRARGMRPLGMVSGTCYYQYGKSWWNGHTAGWHQAVGRMKLEATALGANAVLDVRLRRIKLRAEDSMDFTVLGTALYIDGLPRRDGLVIATVSPFECARLLEVGIVPVGIAIGAMHSHLGGDRLTNMSVRGGGSGSSAIRSYPASRLGSFWENVRRRALANLKEDALHQGNGVLAHTHFAHIFKFAGSNEVPAGFIGRYIAIGTVIDTKDATDGLPHPVHTVVDMRDGLSPLCGAISSVHSAYLVEQGEETT